MRLNSRILLLVTVLLFVAATASQAAVIRFKTEGKYTDSAGAQHSWSINEAHALIWDGNPYVPVGAVFVSKCLSSGPTDENYKADTDALALAKSKGITDVILKSAGPITSSSPAALQKIVDYLEQNGFSYGIELDDGPTEPLSGYVIAPHIYRLDGPSNDAVFAWNWPDVDAALYVVVNKLNMEVEAIGGASVKDGRVAVTLQEPLLASQVLSIYPRKRFETANGTQLGDLWSGFSEYRDRVLGFFKDVKFGAGLRFFVEPFTSKIDFTGADANFIPDSAKFRLGLEASLTKKYIQESAVNAAWGLNDNLDSIQTASRLIPLWGSGRGVSVAYDRASAKQFRVDTGLSQLWRDVTDYRDTSAQEFMNTISDTLKKQVANVPVVFKCPKYHRVYANPYGIGGFDGLGAVAYGTDDSIVTKSAGLAYALGEESGKSTWFITAATGPLSAAYPTEVSMGASLDLLREIGCKGFFVDSLQGGCDLAKNPAQLDWLKSFKDRMGKAGAAEFRPTVLQYPVYPPTGGYAKRLARDTWWLPTLKVGRITYAGDGLGAYGISGEDTAYIWSTTGKRTITLKVSPSGVPTQEFPEKIAFTPNKAGCFSMALSDVPTVLRGVDVSLVFPIETAQAEMDILANMIPEADKQKISVSKAREGLERAKTVLKKGQPLIAYGIAQSAIQELVSIRGGETWVEGESSNAHNFDGARALGGASGNLALLVDSAEEPPMTPYGAYYAFDAPVNSSYELWLAATTPSDSSPVSYTIDDTGWTGITPDPGTLQGYAPGLAWYKIGSANLTPGKHTLRIRIDGKRPQDNRYYFAIDAFVVSPKNFKPNGVAKPY